MAAGEVTLVAIDASGEITDYALEWAVRNVIRPLDSLVLIAILPSHELPPKSTQHHRTSHNLFSSLLKKWNVGKNDASDKMGFVDNGHDMPQRMYNVCSQMIHQLFSVHKVVKVSTEVKVLAYAPVGSVAMLAAELRAKWAILDRVLKKEGNCCLKQYLNCNVVLIDHAIPKFLRSVNFPMMKTDQGQIPIVSDLPTSNPVYDATRTPGSDASSFFNTQNASSSSTSSSTTNEHNSKKTTPFMKFTPSPFSTYKPHSRSQQLHYVSQFEVEVPHRSTSGPIEERIRRNGSLSCVRDDVAINNNVKAEKKTIPHPARHSTDSKHSDKRHRDQNESRQQITRRASIRGVIPPTIDRTSSIRRDMSVSLKKPPTPPPLCSVCKLSAPILGRSPRRFSHEEIEIATNGFSKSNFLAEGGYGKVYKGILADGQVVAVKQHKMASAQGAAEFCSEVEVLSCAQHKNLVMLIGYCIEKEWLLVYEYACNGSLDKHLYEKEASEVMAWGNRMKIALGAARGLRYLHEDCRVGCIIHRDFQPNNILLTHDFEPMVGDFGLARWQADGESADETRVVGAFGYLAPEYTQTGLITEKADVYAFGIVLLELLTGIKAVEFSRNSSQQYFSEWGRRLFLKREVSAEMIDPRLGKAYEPEEVVYMMHAASLCISNLPEQRPRTSTVLRILEGNLTSEMLSLHQELISAISPKPSLDSYNLHKEVLLSKQKQEKSPYEKPMIPSRKLSSVSLKLDGRQDSISKQTIPFNKHNVVTDEYKEYLQGSLYKHILSLKTTP